MKINQALYNYIAHRDEAMPVFAVIDPYDLATRIIARGNQKAVGAALRQAFLELASNPTPQLIEELAECADWTEIARQLTVALDE